jgi:hypothetical protein
MPELINPAPAENKLDLSEKELAEAEERRSLSAVVVHEALLGGAVLVGPRGGPFHGLLAGNRRAAAIAPAGRALETDCHQAGI